MRASTLLLLSLGISLGACSTAFGDKETDDGSGDEDDDGGGERTGGTIDDVDDIVDELDWDTSDCEEVEDQAVPGAVSYFVGSYADQGNGTWRGTEQWVLIANDRWQELEDMVADGVCTVTWTVVATESDGTGACAACDLGLNVNATIDMSNTDCPEDLYSDPTDMNWDAAYAVLTNADGSAEWFYQNSGTPLGSGTNGGGVADYATDKSCKWF